MQRYLPTAATTAVTNDFPVHDCLNTFTINRKNIFSAGIWAIFPPGEKFCYCGTDAPRPLIPSLVRALLLTFAGVCCCKFICVLHASAITYSPLPDCNVRAEVESCRQSYCRRLKSACVCLCFSFNNFAFLAFVLLFYIYIHHRRHIYKLKKYT